MKINLLSDVHTEFWTKQQLQPGRGDVLILAGDIGLVSDLGTKHGYLYQEFLELCAAGYEKVFYVMGNHEHYHYDITRTAETLRGYLPGNFTLLDDSSEFYNGVHFVGTSMWSNFLGEDEAMMWDCQRIMSDYHVIQYGERELTPNDIVKIHNNSSEWLNQCVEMLRGPVVMVSHHAPNLKSLRGRYAEGTVRGAYYTDMKWLTDKCPNIVKWCHGHVHETNDYMMGETNVISNPFGYHPDALNHQFSGSYAFEVEGNERLSDEPCQGLVNAV